MEVEELLPEPEDLYDLLLGELEYLKSVNNSQFVRNKDRVKSAYFHLRSEEPTNWTLDIDPNWIIKIGGEDVDGDPREFDEYPGIAVVGGLINVVDGEFREYAISLSLLAQEGTEANAGAEYECAGDPCCWDHNDDFEYRVVRRYHFDLDIGEEGRESKPTSHLQNGGEFDSELVPVHEPHYCSSPLHKPRLPHPPMDPLLLLHMLARQYPSLVDLIGDTWRNKVQEAEEYLWQTYHSAIRDWYTMDKNDRDTFARFIEN